MLFRARVFNEYGSKILSPDVSWVWQTVRRCGPNMAGVAGNTGEVRQ